MYLNFQYIMFEVNENLVLFVALMGALWSGKTTIETHNFESYKINFNSLQYYVLPS